MVSGQGQGRFRVGLGLGLIMGFGFLSDRAHATTTMATVEAVAPAPLDQPKASSISGKEDEDEPFLLPTQPLSPLSNPSSHNSGNHRSAPVPSALRSSCRRISKYRNVKRNGPQPRGPTEVSRLEQANGIPAPDFSISGMLPEPQPWKCHSRVYVSDRSGGWLRAARRRP
jgi:hypothetical protein